MKKLFYIDTHILDFTAQIQECIPDEKSRGCWLVLDQTAFFPEEGGQAADKGTIDGLEVLDVQTKKDVIYHLVNPTVLAADSSTPAHNAAQPDDAYGRFAPGQTINGHVDWARRFDFMQQHSGEHIISGLLHSHFGFTNVGFHLGSAEVTMDFDHPISLEMLREIEKEANEIIWKDLPVHATFPAKEDLERMEYRSKIEIDGDVRIVEIPGVDVCACCAPHVEHTGEIGMIKITNVQSHRGGVRINILCGGRALTDYTAKQDTSSAMSALLSSKPEKLAENVNRVMDEALTWKNKANTLAQQLLQLQLAALPSPEDQPSPLLFIELDNPVAVRNAVNSLCGKYPGYCSIFTGDDDTGYQFIIGSSTKDCRQLAAEMRTKLDAKCGGSVPMIQGSVKNTRLKLEVFFSLQN